MNEVKLRETGLTLVSEANQIIINSPAKYSGAAKFLLDIKSGQKKVKDYFEDMKKKAHAAWKAVTEKESDILKPLGEAEQTIKRKMGEWDTLKEKERQAEQDRLQAKVDEAARKEQERLQKRSECLKTPELKEEARRQAEEVIAPIVHVESETPQEKGIVYKRKWKVKSIDKKALIKAAAEDINLQAYLLVAESRLNGLAAATEGQIVIPGVEFYEEKTIAAGGK